MSATGIKDIPALILIGSLFASCILIQSSYDMAVATSYQAASLSSAGTTTISTTSNFRINSQNCPGEVAIYVHGWTPVADKVCDRSAFSDFSWYCHGINSLN
jgi:hypothetical protein